MTAPTKASLQRELRAMTKRAEEAEQKLAAVLADLAPLLRYVGTGWLGPAQGNYQRLKALVEGK